jgi:hypothetical protein
MKINNKIVQFERQFDPYKVRVLPDKTIALATIHDGVITVHFKVLFKDSEPKVRVGCGLTWNYSTNMLTQFFAISEKMLTQFRTELTKGEAKNGTP